MLIDVFLKNAQLSAIHSVVTLLLTLFINKSKYFMMNNFYIFLLNTIDILVSTYNYPYLFLKYEAISGMTCYFCTPRRCIDPKL